MRIWWEAARPRTLPASLAPVVVGTAAAGSVIAWRFAATLAVALALQVAVNYANDYFDGVRGVDADRVGPRRAVASGLVSPRAMARATGAAIATAVACGTALAVAVGPELVIAGGASIAALLAYSGGPRPYASVGLGEASVFVFFGLVATAGAAYVQTETLIPLALASGVPMGLLSAAILVVNNLRDIEGDARSGKRTLAVRLGRARTRRLYVGLLVACYGGLAAVALVDGSPWPLLAAATLWVGWSPVRIVLRETGGALAPALGETVRLHVAFSALLAVGLWNS